MARSKIPRSTAGLVDRLTNHCELLEEYHRKACIEGDEKYFGEVAGKLRVLVYRSRSNRPLLLDLMKKCDVRILAQFDKPGGAVEKTLDQYISEFLCAIRLPSGELVELTRHDFIGLWAQQLGASHEDWELDERLIVALNQELNINGLPVSNIALCGICRTVLRVAEHFLAEYQEKYN